MTNGGGRDDPPHTPTTSDAGIETRDNPSMNNGGIEAIPPFPPERAEPGGSV